MTRCIECQTRATADALHTEAPTIATLQRALQFAAQRIARLTIEAAELRDELRETRDESADVTIREARQRRTIAALNSNVAALKQDLKATKGQLLTALQALKAARSERLPTSDRH